MLPDLNAAHPDEIVIEVSPGMCWSSTVIAGMRGAPTTDGHRRAVLVHYRRADVPRRRTAASTWNPTRQRPRSTQATCSAWTMSKSWA